MNLFSHSIKTAVSLRGLLVVIMAAFLLHPAVCRAEEPDTAAAREKTAPPVKVDVKVRTDLARTDLARTDLVKTDTAGIDSLVRLKIETKAKDQAITRNIVIDEEGIILNGKKIRYGEIEDSIVASLTIEGGSIIKFGEPLVVKKDEIVDGDVLSLGGDVTVAGTVTGDVAIVGANLHLLSSGVIKGDMLTFGGSIHQEPGGEIRGQRVGMLPKDFRGYGPFPIIFSPLENLITFGIPLLLFVIVSFLFLALAGFFAPRHIERIAETIEVAPLKSILLGFAALVLALPLFLLLCVTIIGIPVALIAQPIAYFVAGIMGFAGVSLFVGTKLQRGTSLSSKSPLSRIFLGALIIEAALILAWFFTLGGKAFAPLFWLFYLIGWIVYLVAIMAGLGAVIWTRFGIRPIAITGVEIPPVPPLTDADRSDDESEAPAPM